MVRLAASCCLIAFVTLALVAGGVGAKAMDGYAWRHRPLVVFAPSDSHPSRLAQRAWVDAALPGVRARDMVVIVVVGDTVDTVVGPAVPAPAADLRDRFAVAPETCAVRLVGTDTGVKLRASEPVSMARLFAVIDGMPMRRREMRAQTG